MILVLLSSGLFLGWSLGANDAANVFGTAVGTKMVRFKTAALIAGIFVILGAVLEGSGAAHTLGKLGSVNAIAGAFMVAFSAGFTVFWMTRLKLPVSSTQAIVGAIVGWNFFSDFLTDYDSFLTIILTWVVCPILAAVFSMLLFLLFRGFFNKIKIHLLRLDMITRISLIIVGAFGSFSLGANNIANVMGVFVPVVPFENLDVFGLFTLTGTQQLFLLGGIAIAVGIFTYSHKVMETVGESLLRLSPEAALVVVLSESLVLFLFASQGLENWLMNNGLPTIPLVPVSSSQAVVGAILGIGLVKGGRTIKFKVFKEISVGWIATPVVAGVITFISLFFLQNVFNQKVYTKLTLDLNYEVIRQLDKEGIADAGLKLIRNDLLADQLTFESILVRNTKLTRAERTKVIEYAEREEFNIDSSIISQKIDNKIFTVSQVAALKNLIGKKYFYRWQLRNALQEQSTEWQFRSAGTSGSNKAFNRDLARKYLLVLEMFREQPQR